MVPALPTEAQAAAALADRVKASGSSFYWAMRLLPRARRAAMFAIYAFCREVDDIADGDDDVETKRAGLAAWRVEIDAVFEGEPSRPLACALVDPVRRYQLRREDFIAVIDGMAMDVGAAIVAPTLAALDLYCDRVASAVGRLSVRVFGIASPVADRAADHLGRALQLTNILRDVAEDAGLGRVYLPRELLERHGVFDPDPKTITRHPGLPAVCRDVAVVALLHYAEADAAMALCPRREMRPARVMQAVYHNLLDRMLVADWQRFDQRVTAPKAVKLWFVVRYGLL